MVDYYSLIARAVTSLEVNTRDTRRAVYDRARAAQVKQLKNIDAAYSEIEINREFEELEEAVRKVEAEMLLSTESRASSDAKIILDYAAFLRESKTTLDFLYDANALPHPKEVIVTAIEREIALSPQDAHVDWLQKGAVLLWNFVEGVGPDPLPVTADFARRGAGSEDQTNLADISPGPEYSENLEKAAIFMDIAAKEDEQIAERIAAAVRRRAALRSR